MTHHINIIDEKCRVVPEDVLCVSTWENGDVQFDLHGSGAAVLTPEQVATVVRTLSAVPSVKEALKPKPDLFDRGWTDGAHGTPTRHSRDDDYRDGYKAGARYRRMTAIAVMS